MTDQQMQSGNGDEVSSQVPEVGVESIDELKAQLQHVKSIKAGETRKNSELHKQLKEQENLIKELQNSYEQKLTDSERLQYEDQKKANELKKLSDEVALLRQENKTRELKDLKLQILNDNDLQDFDLIKILGGESLEEFQTNVAAYLERQNKISEKIKMNLVNGKTPANGNAEAGNKEIKRADFNKLSPIEKAKTMKGGIKIID
jgi:hypothetical protein